MSIVSLFFPPPDLPEDFERLCAALFSRLWKAPDLKRFGRRGEDQGGTDLLGTATGGVVCAVQCKRRDFGHRLTKREIRSDVKRVAEFNPPVDRFAVATSAKRSAKLQRYFVRRNQLHSRRKLFS